MEDIKKIDQAHCHILKKKLQFEMGKEYKKKVEKGGKDA